MTEMKVTEARKAAAKNIKPSEVDLTKWDGKIKSGTGYGTHAKTIILNVIKVSLISNLFVLFSDFKELQLVVKSSIVLSNGQCTLICLKIQLEGTWPLSMTVIHRARTMEKSDRKHWPLCY